MCSLWVGPNSLPRPVEDRGNGIAVCGCLLCFRFKREQKARVTMAAAAEEEEEEGSA